MKRTPVIPHRDQFPAIFHPLLEGDVYDSSCSPTARVWFLDKDGGYYLKTAPRGTLQKEAEMTRFFHSRKLGTEVLAYESLDADWLLTARIPGEDCTFPLYIQDPIRLCDTTAELLRLLHETDSAGCPVNRTEDYLSTARKNYDAGRYDMQFFPESSNPQDAWKLAEQFGPCLKQDTLLHGDYCLPNIMLDNWRFSAFLDLGTGGLGDRHVDLYWGIWSLNLNLKTNRYRERFLDAYGREGIEEELLRIIGAIEVFG